MKLRSHLILLVVAALLPLLIFAAVLIAVFDKGQRATVENRLVDTARALSLAVDREVAAWISTLEALGASERLDIGNLSAFRKEAMRVLKTREDWNNILLTDSKGRQLVNLFLPPGSPLPHVRDLEQFQQVVKTSQPVTSNLFLGRVSRTYVIGVAVPVVRDGKVKFILASSASPNSLLQILAQQDIPSDWIGTIVDRKGTILARTRNAAKSIGKPAMTLLGAPDKEAEEGLGRGSTDDGTEVQVVFHRSALTGWTVRLAIPVSVLEAPLRRSLWLTVIGGLALLVVGIVLAIGFGQRIAKPIVRLSASAEALGRGETPQATTSPIIEVDEVAQVIEDAAAERKRAEQQMAALHDINLAITSTLDLRSVINLLSQRISLLFPYAISTIRLLNKETGELELVACHNLDEKEWWAPRWIPGCLSTIVFENKSPLAVRDLSKDPRAKHSDFILKYGLVSYLGLPLIVKGESLGVLSLQTKEEKEFSNDEIDFLTTLAGQAAMAIHNSRVYEQARELTGQLSASRERRRALTARVISSREEEARRIARELHDEAGQLLASVYIVLDDIAREVEPPVKERIQKATRLLDQIEEQLRSLAHELRPTILDDLGLLPAIQSLAQRFSQRTGMDIALEEVPKRRLPPAIETALYRTVQEALNNVTKHAQATAVRVQIQQEDGIVRCLVLDNGIGFDVPAVLSRTGAENLGLVGIRERVEILKGKLQIQSSPGQGTQLRVTIPLGE